MSEEADQAAIERLQRDLLVKEQALQVIANSIKLLPPGDASLAGLLLAGAAETARRAAG